MTIPKTLHRIWLGRKPIPPMFEDFWRRWQQLHPHWECRTWTDADDYSWLRNKRLFETRTTPSGQSDVLRIELLAKFGGVYVDADMEPIRPLDPLLVPGGVFASTQERPYYDQGVMTETAVIGAEPFAAREDEHTIAWGAIGSGRGHPAIEALRDAMPAWVRAHPHDPPNVQTGPVFLTHVWRSRTDVRILPRETFYPVLWTDRHKLRPGGRYPKNVYAVHHWAHSWAPKTVILVPWRGGDKYRERNWTLVRPYYEFTGWPVYEGDTDHKIFNRAGAVNAAAEAAGDWEVAVIADADTIQEEEPLRKAVELARRAKGAVMPWNERRMLTQEWSERIATRQAIALLPEMGAREGVNYGGSTLVVSREAWDAVGGMDERFNLDGWGFEDRGFRIALETLANFRRIPGRVWHFWHPPAPRELAGGQRSGQALFDRYMAARRDPVKMRAILAERRRC